MGDADFEAAGRKEPPMNENVPPSPGQSSSSSVHHQLPSSTNNNGTSNQQPLPPPPPLLQSSVGPSSAASLLLGGATGTLLRQPPSQHYFRPIVHPVHHLTHRPPYAGRVHDDFDLTSDSDAISSPTSSIIGPPPIPGVGRPPSPHHLTPLLPVCYNNGSATLPPPNPNNPPGVLPLPTLSSNAELESYYLLMRTDGRSENIGPVGFHSIYSPTGQSGSGPLRFDESSFLGTSDACSSPETGSLPRTSKLTKRKRPPRPPPRRLKTDDFSLPEEDDHHMDDDDDPHIRQFITRYQQQLAVMTMMSSTARMEELQGQDEKLDTVMALSEIRTQLQELTKSVESCQTEVTEVKRDMVSMRHELDMVQHVKEEIDDLRECVDRIDEQTRRRKTRLLEQGLTLFLSFSIFAAVLGMLQFGYNTGVINAPHKEIKEFISQVYEARGEGTSEENESKVEFVHSIVVSIFAIGGMLGGFSGGIIANRFGRKGGLLLNDLIGIGGGVLMGIAKSMQTYELLILGRFIIGVNCGLNTSLVPMYVSEIAPLNLRGALGTVNQLAVTIGLLVSQVLGIEQLLGTEDGWPVLLGLAVVPALLQMLLLPMCPESPRYLFITKQREDEARRALRKFRASNHVEEDIEEMRAEQRAQQAESRISMLQLLRSSTLRMPLCIAVMMQLSQQLSGINAVFYFSTGLFYSAGLKESHAKFATIGVGAIMVGMTLVSIMLMDRAGRRTLHLYGVGGMFIFSIFITISLLIKEFFSLFKEILDWISYLAVIFTLSFVVFFAVGPGSIPWLITAELFSQGPRPAAMSIAVLTNWFANWLVGNFFLKMQAALNSYVFLPFSVLLAIFWIFTYKRVPETKNKTFEEIAALFKRNKVNRAPSDESHIYGQQAGYEATAEATNPDVAKTSLMLNCVNSLGHPPPPESSALIEEKPPIESSAASGRSSRGEMSPPGNIPPPPVPFSIPPYPPRFLDDNAV